jgi:hypothetical protein
MSSDLHAFEGSCHCGAVAFTFRTSQLPERWSVRACQCSFCRAHGARTTTDANASVTFHVADASKLNRYRFGTQSTDFIVCSDCGVYVAALLTSSRGQVATLNINTIRTPLNAPQAQAVSYDGESVEQRRTRRERQWTPVANAV